MTKATLPEADADRVRSIADFCQRNGISRSTYLIIRAEGRGPREMRISANRIGITPEAEADWRRAREKDAACEKVSI